MLHLAEAIITAPAKLNPYLDRRIARLDVIIAAAQRAKAAIATADGEGDYVLRYALGQANGGERPLLPDAYTVDLDRHYALTALRDSLTNVRRFGADRFLVYVLDTLKHIRPIDPESRAILALMDRVEAGFREYGFVPGEHDDDPEYRSARGLADAYAVIDRALGEIEALLGDLGPRLTDLAKRLRLNSRPEQYRPDHGDVETLYHASMFASEIARDGFRAEKPAERRGVGNFGDQQMISFTHSLRIAQDIMRALKDYWMIAHGALTRRTLLAWMRAEHIDPAQAAQYFVHSGEPPDSPAQVMRLYRGYIGLSRLRSDPVFVSPERLLPTLQNRALSDIGIVACAVRLDGDPEYRHGEAEFRVPASRVVGAVRRVV